MKFLFCKIMIMSILIFNGLQGSAQFSKLTHKVKDKIAQRVDKRVDASIDKTLDKVEGKPAGSTHSSSGDIQDACDIPEDRPALKAYSKYDFIPGEEIIYSNSFEEERPGELPAGWNSSGNGVVATTSLGKGNWLQLYQDAVLLTDNQENFTANCTVEFDLLLRRDNKSAVFPQFAFGLMATGDLPTTDNSLLQQYTRFFATELKVQPADYDGSHLHLETFSKGGNYLSTDVKNYAKLGLQYGKIIHVAMQVQGERFRVWFNEDKMYDLPRAIAPGIQLNQLFFRVKRSNSSDEEVGYLVSNIRIARGVPDLRHQLVEEGHLVTNGILFDLDAATIKPASAGVLKEIAGVLKTNKDIRIKIIGHTDDQGSEEHNLSLSKMRAAAVKQSLVNDYGIDAERLETDGRGESQPLGDNKTKEGKAMNRRVELIKL
ncbi:MAG: OmpA family protein [Terrimonas sp.]|nr:OmpA family protein [Terrimonas sp.]